MHEALDAVDGERVPVGKVDGSSVAAALDNAEALGNVVALMLGITLEDADGDALGDADGDALGDALGDTDGDADGDALGDADGDALGDALGDTDGDALGDVDGDALGSGAPTTMISLSKPSA